MTKESLMMVREGGDTGVSCLSIKQIHNESLLDAGERNDRHEVGVYMMSFVL